MQWRRVCSILCSSALESNLHFDILTWSSFVLFFIISFIIKFLHLWKHLEKQPLCTDHRFLALEIPKQNGVIHILFMINRCTISVEFELSFRQTLGRADVCDYRPVLPPARLLSAVPMQCRQGQCLSSGLQCGPGMEACMSVSSETRASTAGTTSAALGTERQESIIRAREETFSPFAPILRRNVPILRAQNS